MKLYTELPRNWDKVTMLFITIGDDFMNRSAAEGMSSSVPSYTYYLLISITCITYVNSCKLYSF